MSVKTSYYDVLDVDVDVDVDLNSDVDYEKIGIEPSDIKYVIKVEELTDSNITEYIVLEGDLENAYHKSLFQEELQQGLAGQSQSFPNDKNYDDYSGDYDYTGDHVSDYDYTSDYCNYRDYRDYRDYEENYDIEPDDELENKEVLDLIETDVDTRNRKGELTKADYRTSNSLVKTHWIYDEIEISSNVKDIIIAVSGEKNNIYRYWFDINEIDKIPVTAITEQFPYDITGIDGISSGYFSGGRIGDSISTKMMEALELNSIEKTEYTKMHRDGQVYITSKYKVPIIYWKDIKVSKADREREREQFNDFTGRGIYIINTREEIVMKNGYPNTMIFYESVQKYAEFLEADIPRGHCPIDFKYSVSSSSTKQFNAKIKRSQKFNRELGHMVDLGYAVQGRSCWTAGSENTSEYITLDLGREINVTHISTMGKPPPVSPFSVNNSFYNKCAPDYKGPMRPDQIYALCGKRNEWDNVRRFIKNYDQHKEGGWVTSYDLYGRKESGKWIRIGNYRCNSDSYTEVIHDIRSDLNGEAFRYLKINPIGFHNSISLSVDVFSLFDNSESQKVIDCLNVIYTVKTPDRSLAKGRKSSKLVRKIGNNYFMRDYRNLSSRVDQTIMEKGDTDKFIRSELKEFTNDKDKYFHTLIGDKDSEHNKDLFYLKTEQNADKILEKERLQTYLKNKSRRKAYFTRAWKRIPESELPGNTIQDIEDNS